MRNFIINKEIDSILSGTMNVNKSLKGKRVKIEAFQKDGQIVGRSDYVVLNSRELESLYGGEVTTFKTSITRANEAVSFKVSVVDVLDLVSFNGQSFRTEPVVTIMTPPSGSEPNSPFPAGQIMPFKFNLVNSSDEDIVLDSIPVKFYVKDNKGKYLLTRTLPTIKGKLASHYGYELNIAWNQKDAIGNVLSPGKYYVGFEYPRDIVYSKFGSSEKIKHTIQPLYYVDYIEITVK
ncbi:hypothetical protein RB620_12240 [Paenibacillus sp. LHD-117]|uniref:hypothetical protein n=1 Tax=Paenibacillus sp. LHD-117 TaxID=3071412 RepID=UPI0027DF3243|nr:hypothetical protein [Paenibacillus sp. LHD-117]MDQ6420206.1 hypothetical protein [Paenibacillus sp. LHD-117]